ncbi:hypothetical protein SLS54_005766 [Diplodia seriata]
MTFKILVPLYSYKLPGNRQPTEWKEAIVYEHDESSDDSTVDPQWKIREKEAREWKPLVDRMNKFNSYEIHRFLDQGAADAFADKIDVIKESQWAGFLYYKDDLDKLDARSGIYTASTRIIVNYAYDVEVCPLGEWLKANTTGDVMTPLRAFLDNIHENYIGANKEYCGYELRIFTDKWIAEGYPPDWHVDECDIANEHGGRFDIEPLFVATTFKGPGTLFMRNRVLSWINHAKVDYEAAAAKDQLKAGELALYRPTPVATTDHENMFGAIHARPDDEDGDRVVVQLMMGTKRQMKGVRINHKQAKETSRLTKLAKQAKETSSSAQQT